VAISILLPLTPEARVRIVDPTSTLCGGAPYMTNAIFAWGICKFAWRPEQFEGENLDSEPWVNGLDQFHFSVWRRI